MTDYTKSTNFAAKDSLLSGNPAKIVKGTEIDTEFNSIVTAIASKADKGYVTGNWTVEESSGTLLFKYSGTAKAKLDSSGNLTVIGNVTAYGTI